jgi:hypothetical protein
MQPSFRQLSMSLLRTWTRCQTACYQSSQVKLEVRRHERVVKTSLFAFSTVNADTWMHGVASDPRKVQRTQIALDARWDVLIICSNDHSLAYLGSCHAVQNGLSCQRRVLNGR